MKKPRRLYRDEFSYVVLVYFTESINEKLANIIRMFSSNSNATFTLFDFVGVGVAQESFSTSSS